MIDLKTKLNVINAVEAFVAANGDIRLKLLGVVWRGWENALLYAADPTVTSAEEYQYVSDSVHAWEWGESLATGVVFRPQPISLENVEAVRDQLADALLEKQRADADYKAALEVWEDQHAAIIQARDGARELCALFEAELRSAAVRLFTTITTEGRMSAEEAKRAKALTQGVAVEYFTAAQPFEPGAVVLWALRFAPWLLKLDDKVVNDFVLALANQKYLGAALADQDCPLKPEQRVRAEIGVSTLIAQAQVRERLGDTREE